MIIYYVVYDIYGGVNSTLFVYNANYPTICY